MTYQITIGGLVLETLAIDGRVWSRGDTVSDWAVRDGEIVEEPLAALRTPIEVRQQDPGLLLATYDGATLGLGSDGPVEVAITMTPEAIGFITGSGAVELITTLSTDASLPPITAPTG